jgi:peptide/nickel transport system substrate-binding protein
MNQKPLGFYLFRYVLGFALFALMAMLYWSSVLIEQDLKLIQGDVLQIKNELLLFRGDFDKVRSEIQNTMQQTAVSSTSPSPGDHSTLPSVNLLSVDPFYAYTLPKLLGPHFKPHGVRKEATIGKPDNLHPFSNWSQVAAWNGMCTVALAGQKIGKYETYTPDMALSMELRHTGDGRP